MHSPSLRDSDTLVYWIKLAKHNHWNSLPTDSPRNSSFLTTRNRITVTKFGRVTPPPPTRPQIRGGCECDVKIVLFSTDKLLYRGNDKRIAMVDYSKIVCVISNHVVSDDLRWPLEVISPKVSRLLIKSRSQHVLSSTFFSTSRPIGSDKLRSYMFRIKLQSFSEWSTYNSKYRFRYSLFLLAVGVGFRCQSSFWPQWGEKSSNSSDIFGPV